MYAESSESLCGSLAEANVTELLTLGHLKNVFNGIRNIMPREIVDAKNTFSQSEHL